ISERGRRIHPQHPGNLLARIAVGMRAVRREEEGIARTEKISRPVDDEFELAFDHVATLLALVLDLAVAVAVRLHDEQEALKLAAMFVRNDDFRFDAFPTENAHAAIADHS